MGEITRRTALAGLATAAWAPSGQSLARSDAEAPLAFGLTPVFLSSDLVLLDRLRAYLERATGRSVRLLTRRTYKEVTALLVSGQLDAAWICGYPFVAYGRRLALVATPIWRGAPLYRSRDRARSGRSHPRARHRAGSPLAVLCERRMLPARAAR